MKEKNKYSKPMVPSLPSAWGYADGCALAEAYAEGKADPVAVTEQCLAKAKDAGPVFIARTEERARQEAEAARLRYKAGRALSLLDGVPVAWKDLFDVAGTVTTAGSNLRRNNPPAGTDSPLPLMAARAGLVCVGKVNTTEFAYSSIGVNPHYGTPVNPHSKPGDERIPGGSSSGSAAAVAAGAVPIAMGSDTGGSVRIPASFNGVVGYKPSVTRYPRDSMPFLSRTLDTPGPLTRSVRDAVVLDRIMMGRPCACPPRVPSLKGWRFVLEETVLADPAVAEPVRAAVLAAVCRLEQAGALVERRQVHPFQAAMASIRQGWLMAAEAFTQLKDILDDEARASQIDQRIRKRAEGMRGMPVQAVVQSYWARAELSGAIGKDLDGAVLITPAVSHSAPSISALMADEALFFHYVAANTRLTTPGNLMDMPGVSLPAGVDQDGMPLGVLLSVPSGDDEMLLRAALAAEEAITKG